GQTEREREQNFPHFLFSCRSMPLFDTRASGKVYVHATLEIENPDVKVGIARKGKPVRKAGTQSYRSKGCRPYDSGITEAAPSCWRFPPLASAFRFPHPLLKVCTPFFFAPDSSFGNLSSPHLLF